MNDIPHIITERVDDIPLLLEQMQRMELPTLIDYHFPAHGHSKDHRLDLPQVKVMQAVLDPLAMPLATELTSED
jgi:transposase